MKDSANETPIEAARRFVQQGEKHVRLQTAILRELRENGQATDEVKKALKVAEDFLQLARLHLALQEEIHRSGG